MILKMQIWQLLIPEMGISKLSGNTVKIITNYLPKAFDIWHFSLQNWLNWHTIRILSLISFNLTPRSLNLVKFEVWSFIKRFTTASSILTKILKYCIVSSCLIRWKWIENKSSKKGLSLIIFLVKFVIHFWFKKWQFLHIFKSLLWISNIHCNISWFNEEIFKECLTKNASNFLDR